MPAQPTARDERRLRKDEKTVLIMAQLYCRDQHPDAPRGEDGLCASCSAVVAYAAARTRACPRQHKGTCDTCDIQCYRPAMRADIRAIMAYSGPRMITRHPLMAIRHLAKKLNHR